MGIEPIPAWEQCDACEDFICNIHDMHVADCPCPAIEDWADIGVYPYADCFNPETREVERPSNEE